VLAHLRDGHKGMGQKASDLSACYACGPCHDRLDHQLHKIEPAEFYFHQLRALQETLEILHADGLLIVPVDPVTPMLEKPIKARKPKPERAVIRNTGRAIPSRPFQKRVKP